MYVRACVCVSVYVGVCVLGWVCVCACVRVCACVSVRGGWWWWCVWVWGGGGGYMGGKQAVCRGQLMMPPWGPVGEPGGGAETLGRARSNARARSKWRALPAKPAPVGPEVLLAAGSIVPC